MRLPRLERARDEAGYVALLISILIPGVFLGCAAIGVDTARWYVEAEKVQRAADAAALAGVVFLPGDLDKAKVTARAFAESNEYFDSDADVNVDVEEGEKPSQLRVTVTHTIDNTFGAAIGVNRTTISRTALADYQGGVAMGSPCNEFGSDPDTKPAGKTQSENCDDAGLFWANVGSPKATKVSGDAFQDNNCNNNPDGCSSGVNLDYDDKGYLYTLTLTEPVNNLRIEAFDPALISVGDLCESNLDGASALTNQQSPAGITDQDKRYVKGTGDWCTGDKDFDTSGSSKGLNNQVQTKFTIRNPGEDPSRPQTWPVNTSCSGTASPYPGYDGDLAVALNRKGGGYVSEVGDTFRRWVPLCDISYAAAGTYAIQVQTNDAGNDTANGHNRFSLRAYSTTSKGPKDTLAISAFNKMAVYANVPNGQTKFFLARVPTSAAGQTLNVRLFDIGDFSTGEGTISFEAPEESGFTFSGCRAVGQTNATVDDCKFTANSAYQGKWQAVYLPVPPDYTCDDDAIKGCWVKLNYFADTGATPTDTTSWQASILGDPVRLVE